MTEYYVSGCIDNGSEVETCDDSEATFWTLYERDDDGLSQGIIDCTFREDAEAAMRVYQERDNLQQQVNALAAETNWWKPERCPVTNRPFFLWIEHPSGGMVPTYGGPYDSYTVPTVDSDGEFCCERYDHDEGAWVDSECLSVRLTDDREPAVDDVYLNSVRAEGALKVAEYHQEREEFFKSTTSEAYHRHMESRLCALDIYDQLRQPEEKAE